MVLCRLSKTNWKNISNKCDNFGFIDQFDILSPTKKYVNIASWIYIKQKNKDIFFAENSLKFKLENIKWKYLKNYRERQNSTTIPIYRIWCPRRNLMRLIWIWTQNCSFNYHSVWVFCPLGCLMSLKIHCLFSHLNYFLKNVQVFRKEVGERFNWDFKDKERYYYGRWGEKMMADYCWSINIYTKKFQSICILVLEVM